MRNTQYHDSVLAADCHLQFADIQGTHNCTIVLSLSPLLLLLLLPLLMLATAAADTVMNKYHSKQGVSIAVWQEMGTLECPPPPQSCAYPTGADVLNFLGFEPSHKWLNAIILVILIIGFRACALLALFYRARSGAKKGY
jgi:hypothetical protein